MIINQIVMVEVVIKNCYNF